MGSACLAAGDRVGDGLLPLLPRDLKLLLIDVAVAVDVEARDDDEQLHACSGVGVGLGVGLVAQQQRGSAPCGVATVLAGFPCIERQRRGPIWGTAVAWGLLARAGRTTFGLPAHARALLG